jgi:hypothetical protein
VSDCKAMNPLNRCSLAALGLSVPKPSYCSTENRVVITKLLISLGVAGNPVISEPFIRLISLVRLSLEIVRNEFETRVVLF